MRGDPARVDAGAGARRGDVDLQHAIDEAASFHLLVTPSGNRGSLVRQAGRTVGFEATEAIYRLELALDMPSAAGVAGTNVAGGQVGEAAFRWLIVERAHAAIPGREPAPIPLDPSQSQRFVMQAATFRFAGGDAFRSFGTGRTFPMADDRGRSRLTVGAVGEIVEGTGCFRERVGNFTLTGELTPEGSFIGHVMVRVLDFEGTLREDAVAPPRASGALEEGVSYLTWIAQKGSGADQENTFSLSPSGQRTAASEYQCRSAQSCERWQQNLCASQTYR